VLEIGNLEVVYHKVVLVLRGISLRVEDGQAVALLGGNGAGKTTLLRAITGLLEVQNGEITKGRILWNGEDLRGLAPTEVVRRGVAQVMERRRIFPDLTVEENLLAGAYQRRDREVRRDVEAQYERFPVLGERRGRQAGFLSGGEQQMLAISRALMARPKLLLLDEPSLGLAPKVVEEVAGVIRSVNDEGVAVLLVEQNAAMALEVADHGYVIETGKVVHEGPAASLRADEDVKHFYLGLAGEARKSFREVKHYRRRKRWLS
jgi:branched-chain amino acid transport system ATP-binding protein